MSAKSAGLNKSKIVLDNAKNIYLLYRHNIYDN